MAATFVSVASTAATFVFPAVTSSTVTVTAPASIASGNLLVAFIHEASNQVFSVTMPSGWTQAALFTPASPANGGTILIAYKYATGTEPANYTFTMTETSGNAFQSTPGGVIVQYANTVASSPIDGSAATRDGSLSTTNVVAPSVTSTAAADLLICAYGAASSTAVSSRPAGMTSRAYPVGSGNSGALDVCDVTLGAAGASGTKTEVLTSSDYTIAASVAILSTGGSPPAAATRPTITIRSAAVRRASVI